jgi:hypothetical protein
LNIHNRANKDLAKSFVQLYYKAIDELADGTLTCKEVKQLNHRYLCNFILAASIIQEAHNNTNERQTRLTEFPTEPDHDPALDGLDALFS